MTSNPQNNLSICFVGLANLPLLAREYGHHGAGGAELQQTLLAKALARRGLAVSMIVGDYGQCDAAEWDGIKTYKAYGPGEGIPVLRFLHPRWTKLWAALKRADADIYYTSCAGALLGQVTLFARLHGRKVVFRVASNSDCDPAKLLIRFWRDKQLYRYGLKRADAVLAQTSDQHRALLRNFGRESRIVESLSEPAGLRRGFHARDIDALWVSNIRGLKRPDRSLELAKRLPELRFHIIGGPYSAERGLFDDIRARAARLPNVEFHGFVPHQEVKGFFERARVLVNTSEIEGRPNSYSHAWAHGAPVVTFIDPDGLIVRNGLGRAVSSLEEMSEALSALASDSVEWERASARCRHYADTRFNENRLLDPYLQAIEGLGPHTATVS